MRSIDESEQIFPSKKLTKPLLVIESKMCGNVTKRLGNLLDAALNAVFLTALHYTSDSQMKRANDFSAIFHKVE